MVNEERERSSDLPFLVTSLRKYKYTEDWASSATRPGLQHYAIF
jgi:hypothetical protein